MINFSEKYDRKKFQLFLKEFLPEDLLENTEELQVDEDNEYDFFFQENQNAIKLEETLSNKPSVYEVFIFTE